jgi:hypothetical protein
MTASNRLVGLTLVFLLAIGGPAANTWAARVLSAQVSGLVSSQPESTVIEVNGVRYLVAVNSAAAAQLATLHVGDSVGLVLDGPATSSASHVVAIIANPGGGTGGK